MIPLDDGPAPARRAYENEAWSGDVKSQDARLVRGTIGWAGDTEVVDLGSSSNDGNTLVKVTLYDGADPGLSSVPYVAPADDSPPDAPPPAYVANGHQTLAAITLPHWLVPRFGTRVLVAVFPGEGDGSAVIVAATGPSPLKQFSETTAKQDYSGYDLVIRAKSVCLRDDDGNFFALDPRAGVIIGDKTGSSIQLFNGDLMVRILDDQQNVKASLHMSKDELGAMQMSGPAAAFIKLKNSDFSVTAINVSLGAFGITSLHSTATPASAVMVGPTLAPGTASIGSRVVLGAP